MIESITDSYALYNGDCIEKMASFPDSSIDISIYSPPFDDLYAYSSSDRDLGNCKTYEEFLEHYEFVVREISRLTKPGRVSCVHCMDIPKGKRLEDFPGDIIRIHRKYNMLFWDRKSIWKEPLRVAIRTRQRSLMHGQLVTDSMKCRSALSDYVLVFQKTGDNQVPVSHQYGLTDYAGDLDLMNKEERQEFLYLKDKYKNYTDDKTNKLSHFIWRRYASAHWTDVRANRMVEYKPAKDEEDERHVCPLHLDIINRCLTLWSNKGETSLTPFAGVGSEPYESVVLGRRGVGIELKPSYFRQSVKNAERAVRHEFENKAQHELELLT